MMFLRRSLVIALYNVFHIFLLPLFPFYFLYRLYKKKETIQSLQERLGFIHSSPKNTKVVWFHAVSVGELLLLRSLLVNIKKQNPEMYCYVTTGTLLGKKIASQQLNADHVSFVPLDFLPSIIFAFKKIRPSALIIVEAELWPNLLWYSSLKKVSCYWINGRVKNNKTFLQRFFYNRLLIPLIPYFSHLYVQSEWDHNYLVKNSIPANRITISGNIKVVSVINAYVQEKEKNISRATRFPCILAGSIHPGELHIIIDTYKTVKKKYPNAQCILAPRHFHWMNELYRTLDREKFSYQLFSYNDVLEKEIMVVDTMGTLFSLYQHADLFYLGGTFVPVGGHNLFEPIVWGVPTLIGPYYHATHTVAEELKNAGALTIAETQVMLSSQALSIIDDEKVRNSMSIAAKTWIHSSHERSQKIMEERFFKNLLSD